MKIKQSWNIFLNLSSEQQYLSNEFKKFFQKLLAIKSKFVRRKNHPENKYCITFFQSQNNKNKKKEKQNILNQFGLAKNNFEKMNSNKSGSLEQIRRLNANQVIRCERQTCLSQDMKFCFTSLPALTLSNHCERVFSKDRFKCRVNLITSAQCYVHFLCFHPAYFFLPSRSVQFML